MDIYNRKLFDNLFSGPCTDTNTEKSNYKKNFAVLETNCSHAHSKCIPTSLSRSGTEDLFHQRNLLKFVKK